MVIFVAVIFGLTKAAGPPPALRKESAENNAPLIESIAAGNVDKTFPFLIDQQQGLITLDQYKKFFSGVIVPRFAGWELRKGETRDDREVAAFAKGNDVRTTELYELIKKDERHFTLHELITCSGYLLLDPQSPLDAAKKTAKEALLKDVASLKALGVTRIMIGSGVRPIDDLPKAIFDDK